MHVPEQAGRTLQQALQQFDFDALITWRDHHIGGVLYGSVSEFSSLADSLEQIALNYINTITTLLPNYGFDRATIVGDQYTTVKEVHLHGSKKTQKVSYKLDQVINGNPTNRDQAQKWLEQIQTQDKAHYVLTDILLVVETIRRMLINSTYAGKNDGTDFSLSARNATVKEYTTFLRVLRLDASVPYEGLHVLEHMNNNGTMLYVKGVRPENIVAAIKTTLDA